MKHKLAVSILITAVVVNVEREGACYLDVLSANTILTSNLGEGNGGESNAMIKTFSWVISSDTPVSGNADNASRDSSRCFK